MPFRSSVAKKLRWASKWPMPKRQKDELLNYDELEYFNSFWDEAYGEFQMGDYSYNASEILFNVDYKAFETEYGACGDKETGCCNWLVNSW